MSPNSNIHWPMRTLPALVLLYVLAHGAFAADVSIQVGSQEVSVGMPFTLDIIIENASQYDPPVLPAIPDLRVVSGPTASTSSYTQIINGRTTRRDTVTFRFRCIIERETSVTIPPIQVTADGAQHTTRPVRLVATGSQTDDLLFVEVTSDRKRVYLGETIQVNLEIWLRPYRNEQFNIELDEQQMFNQLSIQDSSLGDFQLRPDNIKVSNRLRLDSMGTERAYYVYTIANRAVPRAPGRLTFDEVRIVVRYPERLARSRDVFDRMTGRELQITAARPLVASVSPTEIEVLPLPSAGRPATFAGAVGSFDFFASATPLEVAVGDPITLALTVVDRTSGGGARLEFLRPPALEQVPGLADRFHWPTEPMTGSVSGNRKTFMQSIRAKDASITEIPSIQFAYFDPILERYEVTESRPIAITVHPAHSLNLRDIVAAGGAHTESARITELTEVAGGLLANYADPDKLLRSHRFVFTIGHAAVVCLPPLLVGILGGVRWWARIRSENSAELRSRGAAKNARKALLASQRPDAGDVISIITNYIADRFNLPQGTLTASDVIDQVRSSNAPEETLAMLRTLLAECETLHYGRSANAPSASLLEQATLCIDRMEEMPL